ncbi:MAG TPA: AzlC family ABC transporter permease [Albidovulum sp.]|uniref:AzlC family ABC transporter permease n=1 Tax=Albidovulum sp. TaxID=1872424 RepID=UPI002BBDB776|nr:AzlC family ABC transporter permease [Albidovulum sp.]
MPVRNELLAGAKDITPLAIGVGIYGLAFGVLAAQAGMDGLHTGMMSAIVFAGSSQIVAIERIVAGAGAGAAVIAGIALNLRLLLITASLRDQFRGRPAWQVALGAHMAADENWAMMHAAQNAGRPAGYWYFVGGGLVQFVLWIAATATGAVLASAIPEPRALGIDFAFAAAFIAILRGLWRGAAIDLLPWGVSVAVAAAMVGLTPLDPSWSLIAAGLSGAVAAGLRGRG